MSPNTVNICVLILVLLSLHFCHSKPHSLNKRAIVKDYSNHPATFTPLEFEKGEDGKYYLKKEFHKTDSVVNYVETDSPGSKDGKAVDAEAGMAETASPQVTNLNNEPLTEVILEGDNSPRSSNVQEEAAEEKRFPKAESINKVSEKAKMEEGKAPYAPVDTKFLISSKPNSKDEIAAQTSLPPTSKEEQAGEKVEIGDVPHYNSRIIPIPNNFRLPILIPVRQISFGTISVLPFPPSEGSDRLPLPYDDEIVGEDGPESGPLEEHGLPLGDPYAPAIPFTGGFLKELKEAAAKQDVEKQTKIVDVLGKKFVMQSNVMKYPRGDLGHTYVRFMSVKPMKAVDTKSAEGAAEVEKTKEIDLKKKEILAEDELLVAKKKTGEAEVAKEKEIEKEPLKAVETQVKLKTESSVPAETVNNENSFKKYEDPYLKGIEEMINKNRQFSFDEMSDASKEADEILSEGKMKGEKKMSTEEKSLVNGKVIFEGKVEKKMEDADSISKDMKKEKDMEIASQENVPVFVNKKERKMEGSEKTKKVDNKKKCKCQEGESTMTD